MGTNYYAIKNKISLYPQSIHIGKSSAGWKFLFRGYFKGENYIFENLEIKSIDDWKTFLKNYDYIILDEYDKIISYDDFFKMVEKLQSNNNIDDFRYNGNINGYRFNFREFS